VEPVGGKVHAEGLMRPVGVVLRHERVDERLSMRERLERRVIGEHLLLDARIGRHPLVAVVCHPGAVKLSKIVTAPVDAIRRNVAETRAAQANYDAWLHERTEAERAARNASLGVWCTTTDTAPYDFEIVGTVFGQPGATPADAMYHLMLAARSAGGDGVLGATILPSTTGRITGGYGDIKTEYSGYGTAIRRLGPAD
jgi:hypothetical protein